MTTLRKLAIAAAVIAGSAAIVATPAIATPDILNRLDEIDASGTSRESRVVHGSFSDRSRGREVAGGPEAISAGRDETDSGILNRLADLDARGTSRESRATVNPFADRDSRSRGVEVAGDPGSISVEREGRRDGSGFANYIRGLGSTSRESSARY